MKIRSIVLMPVLLRIGYALVALLLAVIAVRAGDYPNRPIKFITGFGPGGPTDLVARALTNEIATSLGQTIAVVNMVGATGDIATQAVANADADGYTFLVGASPLAMNEALHPGVPKFDKDIVAVAGIGAAANVLVVRPSLKVRTLDELVRLARETPNGITCGTLGTSSNSNLAALEFAGHAGIRILPVAYHSVADATKDILAGNIDMRFGSIPESLGEIRSGNLVALATSGPTRSAWLPDVPTIAESGFPGFDVRTWIGVFARNGIPPDALHTIETAIAAALKSDSLKAALRSYDIAPLYMDRDEFTAFVRQDIVRAKTLAETKGFGGSN
jgi:tripartite-type tricarboxylate transporter receptor subunit TctC